MKTMNSDLGSVVDKYRDLVQRYGYSSYLLSNRALHIKSLEDALLRVRARFSGERIRIADLGCGYGVLGRITADYLGATELLCVDLDPERLKIAEKLCDRVLQIDITSSELGERFSEKYHLIIMHGVLEHVYDWDAVMANIGSMLVNDGFLLLSTPNLGSWVNRLLLLLGYQPRDLEISWRGLFGVFKTRRYGTVPIGHVKIATYRALVEYLESFSFKIIRAYPLYSREHPLILMIDKILHPFPSLSRRVMILAQKISKT